MSILPDGVLPPVPGEVDANIRTEATFTQTVEANMPLAVNVADEIIASGVISDAISTAAELDSSGAISNTVLSYNLPITATAFSLETGYVTSTLPLTLTTSIEQLKQAQIAERQLISETQRLGVEKSLLESTIRAKQNSLGLSGSITETNKIRADILSLQGRLNILKSEISINKEAARLVYIGAFELSVLNVTGEEPLTEEETNTVFGAYFSEILKPKSNSNSNNSSATPTAASNPEGSSTGSSDGGLSLVDPIWRIVGKLSTDPKINMALATLYAFSVLSTAACNAEAENPDVVSKPAVIESPSTEIKPSEVQIAVGQPEGPKVHVSAPDGIGGTGGPEVVEDDAIRLESMRWDGYKPGDILQPIFNPGTSELIGAYVLGSVDSEVEKMSISVNGESRLVPVQKFSFLINGESVSYYFVIGDGDEVSARWFSVNNDKLPSSPETLSQRTPQGMSNIGESPAIGQLAAFVFHFRPNSSLDITKVPESHRDRLTTYLGLGELSQFSDESFGTTTQGDLITYSFTGSTVDGQIAGIIMNGVVQ